MQHAAGQYTGLNYIQPVKLNFILEMHNSDRTSISLMAFLPYCYLGHIDKLPCNVTDPFVGAPQRERVFK